jgi:ADP-dependent NAD(P)H-hydrate dehydratase / NAD(P)H-hydrate epimerase
MHRETRERPDPEALLTTTELAAADQAAAASGLGIDRLMLAAGQAIAGAASGTLPVAVLCGPGNNGGDGYAAATILASLGRRVDVFADARPKAGTAAAHHAATWTRPVQPLAAFKPADDLLVIDALYGAGLNRAVAGMEAEAIGRLNASGAMTLSVDVPSGLNGDTGRPAGPVVEANQTITFFRAKPGHWLWPGRRYCGELTVAHIGLTQRHVEAAGLPLKMFRNSEALWSSSVPAGAGDTHKYKRGHCLVISGEEIRTGASRLSARAALNAGAGAVTLAGDRDALRVHAAHVSAIMLREAASPADLRTALAEMRLDAAVIGPAAGIGAGTRERLSALLDRGIPTVIDADALTSLVDHLDILQSRPASSIAVLTPHEGEFTRLFGKGDIHGSKVDRARAASRETNAIIVYKGIDTVIAAPDGRAAINTNAGPELATAGSGDVLSGIIAAHLAQGMPAFEAAAAAVQLHAYRGASFGPGLTADRLVESLLPLKAMMPSAA